MDWENETNFNIYDYKGLIGNELIVREAMNFNFKIYLSNRKGVAVSSYVPSYSFKF